MTGFDQMPPIQMGLFGNPTQTGGWVYQVQVAVDISNENFPSSRTTGLLIKAAFIRDFSS